MLGCVRDSITSYLLGFCGFITNSTVENESQNLSSILIILILTGLTQNTFETLISSCPSCLPCGNDFVERGSILP